MRTEAFEFMDGAGRRLTGWLDLPVGPPAAYAILAHCFACSLGSPAAIQLARALCGRGIGVLRFDFTGLEAVDRPGLGPDADTLVAAATALDAEGRSPSLLVGHSLAGAAVLGAAGRLAMVRAVVTLAAPFDADQVGALIGPAAPAREAQGLAIDLGSRRFVAGPGLLAELGALETARRLQDLVQPLLVLHSPADTVIPLAAGLSIFAAAPGPKSFVSLDGAGHLLEDRGDAAYVAGLVAAWAARRLLPPAPERTDRQAGSVLVEETGVGVFQVEVFAGGGRLLADEPPEVGGLGSGPTPFDLLCAALGTCTAMTLRFFSRRNQWPLEAVRVSVGRLRSRSPTERDVLTRSIELLGPLTPEQRARLLEVAERCPVSRTLSQGAVIRTELRAPAAAAGGPAGEHGRELVADLA